MTVEGFEVVCVGPEWGDDAALEAVLHEVYVGGGFTAPELAKTMLRAPEVRMRGTLIIARSTSLRELLGIVMMVAPEDKGRRIARPDEAEMHLLAVRAGNRGRGVGRALVNACLDAATERGLSRMVLWTQPSMHAARRIYEQAGFVRNEARDMSNHGKIFAVYERFLRSS